MSNSVMREIGEALAASTIAYVQEGDQVHSVFGRDYDFAETVRWFEVLARKVIQTKQVLFSVGTNKLTKEKYLHSTQLGGLVLNSLKTDVGAIKYHFPIHKFNPYVDLFIVEMERRQLFEMMLIQPVPKSDEVVQWVDILNGAINSIRVQAKSPKFAKGMRDFLRLANKNYREFLKYINTLFEAHSRLLVLRIDFGYLKDRGWPTGMDNSVSYDEVKRHWPELLSYLKKSLPEGGMVGFAWKLEYGLDKSFHYHVMVILKGSLVREDVTIAKMIGDHWSRVITEGKGLYYNCNAFKQGYKFCGIGMINHYDTSLLEGLRKAALYMTKTDYYIKMVAPKKGRTFGKGNMPKPRASRRGRPRLRTPSEGRLCHAAQMQS